MIDCVVVIVKNVAPDALACVSLHHTSNRSDSPVGPRMGMAAL